MWYGCVVIYIKCCFEVQIVVTQWISFLDFQCSNESCANCCFDVMISIFTRLLWISLIHVTIISLMWHACFMFLFYVIIINTMAYWYDGAALAATRSPVIAIFWCLIKFTTTTTTTTYDLMNWFYEWKYQSLSKYFNVEKHWWYR